MYDKKKLYIAGMILFTTGSLLCAISSSVNALIAFRALQETGDPRSAWHNILEVFPAYERGRAGYSRHIVAIGIAWVLHWEGHYRPDRLALGISG